jgi:hypothetical protein
VTNDPEELDPEIDAELVAEIDDDDVEDDLAEGFVVEGDEDDGVEPDDETDGDDVEDVDEGSTVIAIVAEDPDEFEEEVAPVSRVDEDADDVLGRQSGEFICTSCFLVKKESQMAVRSRKVCRDCV